MQISIKHLEAQVNLINELTGSPDEPYTRGDDKKLCANIGNYHISRAYGGFALHRMIGATGGVQTPLGMGHIPKRQLCGELRAFIAGIEAARK